MVRLVCLALIGCLCNVTRSSELIFSSFVSHDLGAEASSGTRREDGAVSLLQAQSSSVKADATSDAGGVSEGAARAQQKIAPKTAAWAFTITLAFVVKILCMISNVIYQVSPFPTVKGFYTKRDTGQLDAAPYMGIFFGGFQWCFYGIYAYVVTEKSGFLVLVYANFLGPVLGSCYVVGFWQNCRDGCAVRRLYKYMAFAGALVFLQFCAMCLLQTTRALFFSGLVSSACSFMMSLSMLATVPIVLETRCSASIDTTVTMVGIVSAMLWVSCGCILKDKWIVLPNSAGLCILLFTLSLTVHFPQDPQKALNSFDLDGSAEDCIRKIGVPAEKAARTSIHAALFKSHGYSRYGSIASPVAPPKAFAFSYSGDMGGTA